MKLADRIARLRQELQDRETYYLCSTPDWALPDLSRETFAGGCRTPIGLPAPPDDVREQMVEDMWQERLRERALEAERAKQPWCRCHDRRCLPGQPFCERCGPRERP